MKLLVYLIIGFILWRLWSASGRRKQSAAFSEENWSLRFPTLHEYVAGLEGSGYGAQTFADLQQMLLVTESGDESFHRTEVHHLRRSEGPSWEVRQDPDSRRRSLEQAEAERAFAGALSPEQLHEEPRWQPLPDPALGELLEAAYQRFVAGYQKVEWPQTRVQIALQRERAPERSASADLLN